MAEGFERAKVTFNSDYNGLKNSSIGSYQQTNATSSEKTDHEKAGNNPIEETLSFVKENVTNAEERINKMLEKFGITLEDFKAGIFDHENSDFNERLPKLSDDGNCFVLDNGMQILAEEVADISTDKKGYTISLYPNQLGQVFLPDGLYIDSKLVEDIRVEKDTTTVHLIDDGYLVYDKTNRIVKRKNPVCHVSTQENPILQKIEDYIRSVFFSWDEVLQPVILRSSYFDGTVTNYFSQKITETIWEKEGIQLSNLDALCDLSTEWLNSDGERESLSLYLPGFDAPLYIQGDNFVVVGDFEVPKDAISNIRFHGNSYDVSFKDEQTDKFLSLYTADSMNLSTISRVTVYDKFMIVHFKDGRSLTYEGYGDLIRCVGDWSEEQKGGIFSKFNIYTGTYGGNQDYFDFHTDELLEDEWVSNFLKEKYPDADELDYCLFFQQLTNCGCGYVAMSNFIFDQFEGKEDLFRKYFGYDMYTVNSNGVKKYNYTYLTMELFSYYWSGHDITEIYDFLKKTDEERDKETEEEKFADLTVENYLEKKRDTISPLESFNFFSVSYSLARTSSLRKFLEEKIPAEDYQFDAETLYDYYYDSKTMAEKPPEPPIDIDKIKENLKSGKTIELNSFGYDLYTVDPVTGERGDCYMKNGESHAMTITGFTSKDDLVVSTWGEKMIVDISSADYKMIVSRDIIFNQEEPNVSENAV